MQVLTVDPKTRPDECYFLTLSRAEINKEIRLFTPVRAFYTLRICTFHWHLSDWEIISTVLLGSSIDGRVIFKKELRLFTLV